MQLGYINFSLYTIAISCRLSGVNLFEYIQDVVKRTAGWDDCRDICIKHHDFSTKAPG